MIDFKSIIKDNSNLVNTPDELRKVLISKYPNDEEDIDIIVFATKTEVFSKIKEKEIIDLIEFNELASLVNSSLNSDIDIVKCNCYLLINALNIKITSIVKPQFEKVEDENNYQGSKNQRDNISIHEHQYGSLIVPSTCIDQGYTLHRCSICGAEFKDSYKELSEHLYITVDKISPTCENNGKIVKKCLYCDQENTEIIPPLGHKYGEEDVLSYPTCTNPGITKQVCAICGKEKIKEIPPKGHAFSKWIEEVRPTCTEKGKRARKCDLCDYVEREDVKPLGHKFTNWKKEGKYKVCFCENCGEKKKKSLIRQRLIVLIMLLIVFIGAMIPISIVNSDKYLIEHGKKEKIKAKLGDSTSYVIPNSVTSIGDSAFRNCTSLTSITIPDSVKSIGDWAFSSCTSLTNITIPDSVTSIDNCAFYNCTSLTSITMPNSVTSIGDDAFGFCRSEEHTSELQ